MDSSIHIQILSDIPLTLVCVKGRVTPEIPLKFIDKIAQIDEFDPNIDVLFDFTKVDLELDMQQLKDIANGFMKHEAYQGVRKEVYLVKTQKELAKLSMFSIHARSRRIDFNVESSLRSSISFLGIHVHYLRRIEKILIELRAK